MIRRKQTESTHTEDLSDEMDCCVTAVPDDVCRGLPERCLLLLCEHNKELLLLLLL